MNQNETAPIISQVQPQHGNVQDVSAKGDLQGKE